MSPTKEHIIQIDHIKKRYNFKPDFELLEKVYQLPIEISLLRRTPQEEKIIDELKTIQTALKAVKTALLDISPATKVTLNESLNYITDNDIYADTKDLKIATMEANLNILSQRCDYVLIPPTEEEKTSQKTCASKYIFLKVASIFEEGTNRSSTSELKKGNVQYNGEALLFINDITEILKDLEMKAFGGAPIKLRPQTGWRRADSPRDVNMWEEAARLIADECFDDDVMNKRRDTLRNYSKRVLEIMKQRDIRGAKGPITSPDTVMNMALQSDKWWAHKKVDY